MSIRNQETRGEHEENVVVNTSDDPQCSEAIANGST